jgi:hypothetical protein
MADIYNRAGNDFGGSFAADAAKVVFAGGSGGDLVGASGGVGLLTQQVQVSYSQQITRLYEIGSNFTFLVAGRTQGQIGLGRVLGPRAVQTAFYSKYGNVCNAPTNNLSLLLETGCPTGANSGVVGGLGKLAFLVKNVVLVSIGLTVASQDMIINEQVQALFISLDLNG